MDEQHYKQLLGVGKGFVSGDIHISKKKNNKNVNLHIKGYLGRKRLPYSGKDNLFTTSV